MIEDLGLFRNWGKNPRFVLLMVTAIQFSRFRFAEECGKQAT